MLFDRLTIALLSLLVLLAPVPARAASELGSRLTAMSAAGNGEAAYHLGMLYHMGLAGVPKDARKAFGLFKLAAERGDPMGAYKYGCYFDGQGEGIVKSDPAAAMKYKLVAAEAGYALAQEDVAGHLFAAGDLAGALRWLEAAAAQGSFTPLLMLGTLYSGQAPGELALPKVPKDVVKGWAYMLLAARDIPKARPALDLEVAKLPAAQLEQVRQLVAAWRDRPTPLTRQAGIDAAYRLAGLPVPAA